MGKNRGFTLIELVVVIAVIVILSAIILFTVNQYINKGKDSNIKGNLVVLVASGEVYYNGPGGNSYRASVDSDFCDSSVVINAFSRIPSNASPECEVNSSGDRWVACAQLFTDTSKAYCVDSRGVKEEIDSSVCNQVSIAALDPMQCNALKIFTIWYFENKL